MVCGINPETSLRNIIIRNKERIKSKNISKRGIKSALVVQGGAMRGIFSAGSLIALHNLGLRNAFDAIYASSGGAMNVAYFLSDQPQFGTSIYYEDINNSNFINLLRVNKIVDIDYLFDNVVINKKPLDTYKVIKSKTPFYFFATDIETGRAVRCNSKSKNILKLLKASCALPLYYNKPVLINHKGFLDGGIQKAVPLEDAIKDGCTDVLVLLTEPKPKKYLSFLEKFLLKKALSKLSKNLFGGYLTGFEDYKHIFNISTGKIKIDNMNIATILPDDKFRLTRLTKNKELLKWAAVDGAKSVFVAFNRQFNTGNILKYS
ncbi:patatin-like phospholipase family protein [Candidatus Woesearchaeota archaeon]|nr:patatin-like phospholipase family protein [Candidatus Woesearchaeota archaeon]